MNILQWKTLVYYIIYQGRRFSSGGRRGWRAPFAPPPPPLFSPLARPCIKLYTHSCPGWIHSLILVYLYPLRNFRSKIYILNWMNHVSARHLHHYHSFDLQKSCKCNCEADTRSVSDPYSLNLDTDPDPARKSGSKHYVSPTKTKLNQEKNLNNRY